jgi:AAA15 family ATPase/GTPase
MKLLNVGANNFKLCADNFNISFLPTGNKTRDDKEFELLEIDDGLFVFNTIGIIGKNASGKTTAVDLLSVVYDLFSNYRIKSSINLFKFNDKPLHLDIAFYHEGYVYRYITDLYKDYSSVDNSVIFVKNEKLYKRKYFKSHAKNILDYKEFEEVKFENKLPDDTSMLYLLFEKIDLKGIYCSSDDDMYRNYAAALNIYKSIDSKLDIVTTLLKLFDEHLDNIEMVDENKFKIIYTNKLVKEVTNTELYEILSSGTTKGFHLFTFVIYSLKTGTDLIIDEIENHFHKTLVENLVSLYKDKSVNKNNATLIFTTHYCELLDLFGRSDNIYISKFEKNIILENMHNDYNLRSELKKSNKFYNNEFKTDVDYNALMNFKKELM